MMKLDRRVELLSEISRHGNKTAVSRLGSNLFSEKQQRKVILEFEQMGLIELNRTKQGIFSKVTPLGIQLIMDFNKEETLSRLLKELKYGD